MPDIGRVRQYLFRAFSEKASSLWYKRNMRLEVYCDGASRGNPGLGAAGVIIRQQIPGAEQQVDRIGLFLGNRLTNNQAEYLAIVAALKYIQNNFVLSEYSGVIFHLDSELAVKQLNGMYKVKNEGLQRLNQQVKSLIGQLPMVKFKYIPRDQNQGADELANLVLDLAGSL